MKRIWKMTAVLALCICLAVPWGPAQAQGEDIRVLVNGEEL